MEVSTKRYSCLQRWRAKRPGRKLPSYSSLNSQEMPLSFKHIFVHHAAFLEASEYTCVRKLCLAPRHSGRDAFSRAIIFLLRSVTKYYSLTLKITASVLHGFRKCVRELMVYDNRWLTLLAYRGAIAATFSIYGVLTTDASKGVLNSERRVARYL